MSAGNWCTIESDPGVMTELIRKIGVKGVQAEELFDLSPEGLGALSPVYGLIFLFKWQDSSSGRQAASYCPDDLFFAKQMIENACATQAIMNILLNVPDVDIGEDLKEFKLMTSQFTAEDRGLAMSNLENVRTVHNSFSRQEVFSISGGGKSEDAFHFVGYIPHNGRLYELDGLQASPIDHGKIEDGTPWTTKAGEILQNRIAEYSTTEIRFNLCALIKSRKDVYSEQIAGLKEKAEEGSDVLISDLEQKVRDEEAKFTQYERENVRRRHNYIPLFLELMRTMAKTGKLEASVTNAKAAYADKVKAHQAKKTGST